MNVQRQIDRLVALRAADWYERLKDDVDHTNREFIDWVTESPRHMEAFLAIAGQAPMIRRVFAAGPFDLAALLRNTTPGVLPLPVRSHDTTGEPPAPRRRIVFNFKSWSAAAAVVAVVVSAAIYKLGLSWQHFETPIGEQRTIQLTEGSIVNLNAQSHVEVHFDASQRDVHLLDGEATFKVAKDRSRPFRVYTPGVVVEAVGTQFNVYTHTNGTTTVAVLEGRVKITSTRSSDIQRSTTPLPLAAGEEATISSSGQVERESHLAVAEAIAWQQRKLIFKRTSLEDMATEFNRYNRSMRIRLEGIEPGAFRFSGAFNADDPQSLALVLMHEPELEVQQSPTAIIIRRSVR